MGKLLLLSVVVLFCAPAQGTRAEFIPGHIFVSDQAGKMCSGPPEAWDRIGQVNPQTGQVSLFAELSDEWCGGVNGLAFTPDGTRLRVAQSLESRILELGPDGVPSILYDVSDGISIPSGRNCIAFDRHANFFVSNAQRILKFPTGSDVGEVYADRVNDGLGFVAGPLAADPFGNLYFGTHLGGFSNILRFEGPHQGVVFDDGFGLNNDAISLAVDSCGTLYAGFDDNDELIAYPNGDRSAKRLIFSGSPLILAYALTLDVTESIVYVATLYNEVVSINPETGQLNLVAALPDANLIHTGIAVVPVPDPPYGLTPCPPPIPTVSTWGLIVFCLLLLIGGKVGFDRKNLKPFPHL